MTSKKYCFIFSWHPANRTLCVPSSSFSTSNFVFTKKEFVSKPKNKKIITGEYFDGQSERMTNSYRSVVYLYNGHSHWNVYWYYTRAFDDLWVGLIFVSFTCRCPRSTRRIGRGISTGCTTATATNNSWTLWRRRGWPIRWVHPTRPYISTRRPRASPAYGWAARTRARTPRPSTSWRRRWLIVAVHETKSVQSRTTTAGNDQQTGNDNEIILPYSTCT